MTEAAQTFMTFDYAETKDLCLHFLTLVSGVLVLSVTFAERIVAGAQPKATPRVLLCSCWTLLIAAMIACGIALVLLAAAAGDAVYGHLHGYPVTAWSAYRWVVAAGTCFVAGLVMLVVSSAYGLFRRAP